MAQGGANGREGEDVKKKQVWEDYFHSLSTILCFFSSSVVYWTSFDFASVSFASV